MKFSARHNRHPLCSVLVRAMAVSALPLSPRPTLSCLLSSPSPSVSCILTSKTHIQSFLQRSHVGSWSLGKGGARRGGWPSHKSVSLVVRAGDLLGDFGARDPFPAEIASNFGEKVIGNQGTEHNILIPTFSFMSLSERTCQPLSEGSTPLSEDEAKALLRKQIATIAEAEKHHPDLHLEQYNRARAELWTHSIGGLSENDFILAAKIDQINTRDLISKKNKYWA